MAEPPVDRPGRRVELLSIAGQLIARRGYSGTTLRDVADAAGILTGSIYHHFPSKDALAIELVRAFHTELEELTRAGDLPDEPVAAIREFARRAAELADVHGGAVALEMLDAPSSAGAALSAIVRSRPATYDARWRLLLEQAAEHGCLRPGTDLGMLRLVLRDPVIDFAVLPRVGSPGAVARSLVDLVLDGLVLGAPSEADLDRSAATAVAIEVASGWDHPVGNSRSRRGQILEVARHEFARRGYESTTMRDIAAAAGMRPSSLYRHVDSKQATLSAIIDAFSHVLLAAFEKVLAASSSSTEALDALTRLMCSATEHFRPEFAIMSAWWRTRGTEAAEPAVEENAARLGLLTELVRRGVDAGEFGAPVHADDLPLALRDLLWTPPVPDVAVANDPAERFRFLRRCLLRGAALTPRTGPPPP